MVESRDFTAEEIAEVNSYVVNSIPYSILQSIFPLTENPKQKIRVFTIIYRILNGAKNYVSNKETKEKLIALLEECKECYNSLYSNEVKSTIHTNNFGMHRINTLNEVILCNFDNTIKMNKLIDVFLMFAEKQTLYDLDKIAGIELDTKEGEDLKKRLVEGLE